MTEPSHINVGAHPRRLRRASDAGGVGCSAVLAGPFKCANLLSHRLRKIDEGELPLVKEVILSTLVDNSHKVVFGRLRIG